MTAGAGVPEEDELELLLDELELLLDELELLLDATSPEELELLLDELELLLDATPPEEPPPPQALIAADKSVTQPSCTPRFAILSNSKFTIDLSQC